MAIKDDAFFVAVGAVILIGGAWYIKNKLFAGAKAIAPLLDPTNPNNVANSAFNSVYQAMPGENANSTLGGDLYDLFHPKAILTQSNNTNAVPNPDAFSLGTASQPFGVTDPVSGW
jgi:hypothetical protein